MKKIKTENHIDGDLDIKKAKIRITTMLDYPLLSDIKTRAKEKGIKYQSYINELLALAVRYEDRLDVLNIEEKLNEVVGRLKKAKNF